MPTLLNALQLKQSQGRVQNQLSLLAPVAAARCVYMDQQHLPKYYIYGRSEQFRGNISWFWQDKHQLYEQLCTEAKL